MAQTLSDLQQKSLKEILDLTEHTFLKQQRALQDLKTRTAKNTGRHLEFLRKSKEKTMRLTKNNFRRSLVDLKASILSDFRQKEGSDTPIESNNLAAQTTRNKAHTPQMSRTEKEME